MTIQFTPPRDAEDREIPRGTNVMYDINGKKLHITKFIYQCDAFGLWSQWKVFSSDIKSEDDGMLPTESLYLTQPDSWEKLEEDLGRVIERIERNDAFGSMACTYTNRDENAACNDCKFYNSRGRCLDQMVVDIASRIHNLRNED